MQAGEELEADSSRALDLRLEELAALPPPSLKRGQGAVLARATGSAPISKPNLVEPIMHNDMMMQATASEKPCVESGPEEASTDLQPTSTKTTLQKHANRDLALPTPQAPKLDVADPKTTSQKPANRDLSQPTPQLETADPKTTSQKPADRDLSQPTPQALQLETADPKTIWLQFLNSENKQPTPQAWKLEMADPKTTSQKCPNRDLSQPTLQAPAIAISHEVPPSPDQECETLEPTGDGAFEVPEASSVDAACINSDVDPDNFPEKACLGSTWKPFLFFLFMQPHSRNVTMLCNIYIYIHVYPV